jgi:hypothetical protein
MAKTAFVCVFSLWMSPAGVFPRRANAVHLVRLEAGDEFAHSRYIRQRLGARRHCDRGSGQPAYCDVFNRCRHRREVDLDLAAEQIRSARFVVAPLPPSLPWRMAVESSITNRRAAAHTAPPFVNSPDDLEPANRSNGLFPLDSQKVESARVVGRSASASGKRHHLNILSDRVHLCCTALRKKNATALIECWCRHTRVTSAECSSLASISFASLS